MTQVPRPVSPRSRSRVAEWDTGTEANVRQRFRDFTRSDVDQTWTNGDAEVIALPDREDENGDLPADSKGGRYWVRTSDPCVVRAAPANSTTSANAYLRRTEPLSA